MNDLWAALCLVLVVEGVMCFLMADQRDHIIEFLSQLKPKHTRTAGIVMIVLGLVSLQMVRG